MQQILRGRIRDTRILALLGGLFLVAVAVGAGMTLMGASSRFAQATSTLSVLGGQVHVVTDDGSSRSGIDGEALLAGMAVRPRSPDGRAVLTFRDGSTMELEPGASVRIEQLLLGTRGELVVILRQESGRTWSHVQPLLSASSRFHIRTPLATVVVRGTSFEIEVDTPAVGSAVTRVSVFDGRVDLVARGKVEPVSAGNSAEVVDGTTPSAAQRLAPEGICTRIEVTSTALVTVTDPAGRSAGLTPFGTVSQIPRTILTGPQTDPQSVDIFAPTAGEWEIGLVPRGDGGPLQLRVITAVRGQNVEVKALTMVLGLGQRALTNIRLDPSGRSGSLAPPVLTTATRAVALPSDTTTTAPMPGARIYSPEEADPLVLGCVPPEESDRTEDVKPVVSPQRTPGR